MPDHPLARLPAVRAVVAAVGPGSPVLVRSDPGGGNRTVVEVAAELLSAEGHEVVAVPDVASLSEVELLETRRAARAASVLVGSDGRPPSRGADSLAAYLQPVTVTVVPLDVDAVRVVVEVVTGEGCDDDLAQRIRTWTGGLLDDVVDVARHLSPGDEVGPPAIRSFEPTRARLARTDQGASAGSDPAVHRWAIATTAGVTTLAGDGPTPADHPIDAAVLVEGLGSEERRRALEALVAAASGLAPGALDPPAALAVGVWCAELSPGDVDPTLLGPLLAGFGAAFALNLNPEAVRLSERVWHATREPFAAVGLAAALARSGPSPLLDEVEVGAGPLVADWVCFTRATWRFYCEHDPAAAIDLLTTALRGQALGGGEVRDEDRPTRGATEQALLDDALATFWLHLGQPSAAERHLAPRLAGDARLTPFAVNTVVLADVVRARHRRAIDRLAAELDSRLDPGPNLSSNRYRFFRALAASQAGWVDLDPAAELEELYRLALDQRDEWTIGWVGWGAGVVAGRNGRFDTARRRLERSAAGFTRAERPGFASWAVAELAALAATVAAGVVAPAATAPWVAQLEHPAHAVAFARSSAELALARVARARGAPTAEVSAALSRALTTARAQDEVAASAEICIEQVLAGLDAGEPADDPRSDGVLAEVWPTIRADTPDGLEQAGLRLLDCGWSVLGARVLARSAEAQRTRDPRQATRVLQLVRRAVAPFEQPLAPWALDRGVLPTLSPRELEVARGVADGWTRDELALRLVVSRRTIDSHLQRIYAKLGVSNRSELRSWLDG